MTKLLALLCLVSGCTKEPAKTYPTRSEAKSSLPSRVQTVEQRCIEGDSLACGVLYQVLFFTYAALRIKASIPNEEQGASIPLEEEDDAMNLVLESMEWLQNDIGAMIEASCQSSEDASCYFFSPERTKKNCASGQALACAFDPISVSDKSQSQPDPYRLCQKGEHQFCLVTTFPGLPPCEEDSPLCVYRAALNRDTSLCKQDWLACIQLNESPEELEISNVDPKRILTKSIRARFEKAGQ